VTETKVLIN